MQARRRFVVSIAGAGVALLLSPSAALAAARFASPNGTSSSSCPQTAPCDIVTAINKASPNDDVTIEPGTYGPISTTLNDETHTLTIHGQAGAPRPVIIKSGGFAILLAGLNSSLSDVEVDVSGANSFGIYSRGVNVSIDRVISHVLGSESYACEVEAPVTMTNSVCVADGQKSYAFIVFSSPTTPSATLRNDTLEAPGGSGSSGGVALWANAFSGYHAQVALINTIAHGANVDLLAQADATASSEAMIAAEHSNYLTDMTKTEGGKASVTPHGSGTNQTAAPQFVNTAMDDFHELAGSPTVGAGFGSPANGLFDLDGSPRQFGGRTDIGAYQLIPPPTCQALASTTAFGHTTTVQLQCTDALGAPLTYALVAGSAHGTATLNAAAGTVTYTPSSGYSGPDSFSYDATSSHGTAAVATVSITVSAALAPTLTPPTVANAAQSHSSWRLGNKLASFSRTKRAPLGTTFSFTLNQQAKVSFAFTQQLPGRKVKGKCVAQNRSNRRRLSCKRTVTQGTLSFAGHNGVNKVAFQGRISRSKKLGLGRYTLLITATNAAGQRSSPQSLRFTIVK